MKSPLIITGLQQSGKTTFINAILRHAQKKGKNGAALKPFDVGALKRNANEALGDGELFCQNMQGEPMENLVSPYCAHEEYPVEMSFRRDGIKINWGMIKERLSLLDQLYDFVLIETPGSLYTPVTEEKFLFDWIKEPNQHVIFLVQPEQSSFPQNLAEIKLLMDLQVPFSIVFNNSSPMDNQDLAFYIWEKIEAFSKQEAEGMVPFIKGLENNLDILGEKIEESIPEVFTGIVASGQS